MPINTRIDVNRPSAFTIRNHAFGSRPTTRKADRPANPPAGALAQTDRRQRD